MRNTYFDLPDLLAILRFPQHKHIGAFENEFAKCVGLKYAIGTSYGRTALYLGLKAIDVSQKEVILPSFICSVVRHAVRLAGGIPVFVDVNLDDFSFDLEDLKRKVSVKTKAIILVHYYGNVSHNLSDILRLAENHDIALIEDCAHSLGAEINGKKIGTFGKFSIFSLTKGMINFGGGVLATNDLHTFQKAKLILQADRPSALERVNQIPLIIEYGLEQMIDKLIFDRPQKSIFKWWIIHVPRTIILLRKITIKLIKFFINLFRQTKPTAADNEYVNNNSRDKSIMRSYEQGIHMEPIIASLARSQLMKINCLIKRRQEITKRVSKIKSFVNPAIREFPVKSAYSYVIFHYPDKDIFKIIQQLKKYGILLRATWPTHQTIWKNQQTKNLKRFAEGILTWHVNPNSSRRELERFIKIANSIST